MKRSRLKNRCSSPCDWSFLSGCVNLSEMFLLNNCMFHVEGKKIRLWVRQVPAWMCFSNISSWSVFWPLGGACCSWQLRSKAAQRRAFNAWMMNVGETPPIVIYFRSIFTAEEREQSEMSDMKGSKATAVARVSTYLRDFTLQKKKKKAKTLTGFCTRGSVEQEEKQACLWQQENEGLLWKWASKCDTEFWQQPPRLSPSPAVCDYPAWQSNREVICD